MKQFRPSSLVLVVIAYDCCGCNELQLGFGDRQCVAFATRVALLMTLIPKSDDKAASFSVNANPEQVEGIGATGKNFYYIYPESGTCFSQVRPATAQDDTL